MRKTRVLLAEDDAPLGYVIKDNLEQANYEVVLCSNGQEAIDKYNKDQIDICLLDVMMPEKDGFTVAKKIRQQSDMVPILFLTARSMEEDKIKGFQTGADDYITKPFSIKELLLRIEVFLRRSRKIQTEINEQITIGQFVFRPASLELRRHEAAIQLTHRESDLIAFLCAHANKVIRREEILLAVWGKDDYFLGRSMDVFMAKLRKHFKEDPSITLETIHGVGFRFNIPISS